MKRQITHLKNVMVWFHICTIASGSD